LSLKVAHKDLILFLGSKKVLSHESEKGLYSSHESRTLGKISKLQYILWGRQLHYCLNIRIDKSFSFDCIVHCDFEKNWLI